MGWLRFSIVISCCGFALCRTRRAKLRAYFGAQIANAAIGGLALALWGISSLEYALAFVVAEAVVFAAMMPLVHASTYYCEWRTGVFLISASVGLAAAKYSIHGEPKNIFEWVGLWDTGTLMAMAAATAIGAAYLDGVQKKISRVLMLMWLSLASFHFLSARNLSSATWGEIHDWMPAAIVSIGCLWLSKVDAQLT